MDVIKRNFINNDFQGFLQLYKAMINSHLEYAQTAWSPYRVKLVDEVEKVQKRARYWNSSWTQTFTIHSADTAITTIYTGVPESKRRHDGNVQHYSRVLRSRRCIRHLGLHLSVYPSTRGHNNNEALQVMVSFEFTKTFTVRVVSNGIRWLLALWMHW